MNKLSRKSSRVQSLETFALFAAVALIPVIFYQKHVFAVLALALLGVAIFLKSLAEVITGGWLRFSLILSGINNRIILTIIFYLLLTPIACMYRLFNKDPLGLSQKESGSNFCERNHTYTKADLEKMW
jgi:hypothetical protein